MFLVFKLWWQCLQFPTFFRTLISENELCYPWWRCPSWVQQFWTGNANESQQPWHSEVLPWDRNQRHSSTFTSTFIFLFSPTSTILRISFCLSEQVHSVVSRRWGHGQGHPTDLRGKQNLCRAAQEEHHACTDFGSRVSHWMWSSCQKLNLFW